MKRPLQFSPLYTYKAQNINRLHSALNFEKVLVGEVVMMIVFSKDKINILGNILLEYA